MKNKLDFTGAKNSCKMDGVKSYLLIIEWQNIASEMSAFINIMNSASSTLS
jgi:hypothetical protein